MSLRRAALVCAAMAPLVFAGCIDRPVKPVQSVTQSGISEEVRSEGVNDVDLLLMVDNSGSMRDNQSNIMRQFRVMIEQLTTPPCRSPLMPTPHTCGADPLDTPVYPPVRDMHVGVVSSDLGTPGSSVPGCANGDLGDDGLLNPIRNGGALASHRPAASAPSTFGRPADCTDPNEFPSFITFTSGTTNASDFTHDFQCNAGLYVGGCGLESQLDAVYRALVIHDARDTPGNTSPNAGFLRENALLAIVMLTDEEDGSVRDCRFANGQPCDGPGALDAYNPASTAWSSLDLNLRFYMYQPCGPQDPTWPLSRYIDPTNPQAGLLGLKPNHPDLVMFAAIAGVPLNVPTVGTGATARIDWNGLLGTPSANGPDDFCGRDTSGLAALTSAEGPISMAQAHADPNCSQRVVPACRRQNTTAPDPSAPTACTTESQYFAWPSRRIVEVARRFDEAPLCHGAPCNNGFVTSVCSDDYAPAMQQIVDRIASHFQVPCLPRVLQTTPDVNGNDTVQCLVRETLPEGVDACDESRARLDPEGEHGMRAPMYVMQPDGSRHRVCDIEQVPTDSTTQRPIAGTGWFYDRSPDPQCTQRISFTSDAIPTNGSVTRLECIQSVIGASAQM